MGNESYLIINVHQKEEENIVLSIELKVKKKICNNV